MYTNVQPGIYMKIPYMNKNEGGELHQKMKF